MRKSAFSAQSPQSDTLRLEADSPGLCNRLKEPGVAIFNTHFTKKSFEDGHKGEDIFDDGVSSEHGSAYRNAKETQA